MLSTVKVNLNDFKNMCRTCMFGKNVKPIQDKFTTEILKNIIDIDYDEEDELPKKLCSTCIDKINEIHKFAVQCKRNDLTLRSSLASYKRIANKSLKIDTTNKTRILGNGSTVEIDKIKRKSEPNDSETKTEVIDQLKVLEESVSLESIVSAKEKVNKMLVNLADEATEIRRGKLSEINFAENIVCVDFSDTDCYDDEIDVKSSVKPNPEYSDLEDVITKALKGNVIVGTTTIVKSKPIPGEKGNTIKEWKKPPKCNICNKEFQALQGLKVHQRQHSGEKSFLCEVCSKAFHYKGDLVRHFRQHTGERPYQCTLCPKTFQSASHLSLHKKIHADARSHKCQTCGKGFNYIASLRVHMRKHSGERPYVCPFCENTFADSGALTKHKRTHTGEKPYQCTKCPSSFARNDHLVNHYLVHSDSRPYQCPICEKTFKGAIHVRKHKQTHFQEKPFKCEQCNMMFKKLISLQTHEKKHHKDNQYDYDILME